MKIGFIGLGHMGLPMALNLVKAGHDVLGFDLNQEALNALESEGGKSSRTVRSLADEADVIFTMLPEGKHVRSVYYGDEGIFENAKSSALLVECSTTDMQTSFDVHEEAEKRGLSLIDAPVSGGVKGAADGTLTFMVGGGKDAFHKAEAYLKVMGARIVHCGKAGTGQAAKICNNMVLGVSMIATCEAFLLADKLGLSADKFFEVASGSSAQSWSLTSYCPVPGPVPTSPANRDYAPGFTAPMMLKDLKLAQRASEHAEQRTPIGHEAMELYTKFCEEGGQQLDFSGIINWLRSNS